MSRTITVRIKKELSMQDVANIVITALEGGSNYWIEEAYPAEKTASGWQQMLEPKLDTYRVDGVGPYANPEFWDDKYNGYIVCAAQTEYLTSFIVTDDGEPCKCVLSANRLAYGIARMVRADRNDEVARIFDEQYDANDADVLLQYCMFEEVVYG